MKTEEAFCNPYLIQTILIEQYKEWEGKYEQNELGEFIIVPEEDEV